MVKSDYQHIMSPSMAKDIGKIGVLYGGVSDERAVSLESGKAVYAALKTIGMDAELIDVTADFLHVLLEKPFDFAFVVLHGRGGEDGTVQAMLDWLNIPYTGSGVRASAIAMDKVRTKQLWQANGLPVLPQMILEAGFEVNAVIEKVGLPMAVKPALEGSSNGISKVETRDQLLPAYEKAAQHDSVVMAETWVTGDELTGAIIGDEPMPLIRIKMASGFYDYTAKYVTGATEYKCPCGLPAEQEQAIQTLMLEASRVVGTRDWARVDVMLDANDNAWLIEINTLPGMTATSLVPKAARQAGMNFEETVLNIIKIAWEERYA